MGWHTEGEKTNPAGGTLLADTGALGAATYNVAILFSSTVAATALIQRRNAANNATLAEQLVKVGISETVELSIPVTLDTDERVRAVMDTAIVGKVQASILY